MSTLFRHHSNISCFFCQEPIDRLPRDPRSFRCPHCTCWNRYDAKGEIMSDEPAMHDEALNSRSFAKRASPSKDHLPTMYGANREIFCHTCQTNQMLLTNLLSNYLPPPEHPEYKRRLEMLPEYRESLHIRYPPVCENCLPAVEEEIRLKDQMARTRALGGWLEQSKGKEKQRKFSKSVQREKLGVSLFVWKARGCLWALSLLIAVVGNSAVAFGYALPRQSTRLYAILPALTLLSLLWAVWDPTYASFRKAQIQGRDVRLQGKRTYIILQMLSWFSRLTTSVLLAVVCFRPYQDFLYLSYYPTSFRSRIYFSLSLALELFTSLGSCYVLRLRRPPEIRLLDTNGHRFPSSNIPSPQTSARSSPAPRQPAEPDLLSSLTLSSTPVIPTVSNPIFGLPSLLPANAGLLSPERMTKDDGDDADAMDWTPTDSSSISKPPRSSCKSPMNDDSDGSWLRPQRFFPPEQPTGLEGLFARTLLVDDSNDHPASPSSRPRPKIRWWVVCTLLLAPPLAFAYTLRWRWNMKGIDHIVSKSVDVLVAIEGDYTI